MPIALLTVDGPGLSLGAVRHGDRLPRGHEPPGNGLPDAGSPPLGDATAQAGAKNVRDEGDATAGA